MRAEEFLTEDDLKEYKVIDNLLNMKQLKVGLELFKKYQSSGLDEQSALLDAARDANVSAKILQRYLIDKKLIKHTASKRSMFHDTGTLGLTQ